MWRSCLKWYSVTHGKGFLSYYRWAVRTEAAGPVSGRAGKGARTPAVRPRPVADEKMRTMNERIRVTQLFDCADVGRTLVQEGRRHGMPWRQIQGPWTRGGGKSAYYRFRAEQALAYPLTQLWHVNMGGRAKWARGAFSRPYALTLHGTDIRENYWQEQHHAAMKQDIDGAAHVWYTTPDLREKAERARPDAEYLPAPVDMSELPAWNPSGRPTVIFPSRWDASKGGDALLETAAEVVSAAGGQADIVGLDWGDRAAEARDLGVRLLPKMSKAAFLQALSTAHVAVGQVAGILAVSELQAMGIGVPLVFADAVDGYPEKPAAVHVSRGEVAGAVTEALQDPAALSRTLDGPGYVRRNHGAEGMIPKLNAAYARILEEAR